MRVGVLGNAGALQARAACGSNRHCACAFPCKLPQTRRPRVVRRSAPGAQGSECAAFHDLIRRNFTPHEIALWLGRATPHLDYRTNYDRVQERYASFLQDIADNGLPVAAGYSYDEEP